MSISQVVVFFMFYSFIGWVWEIIYNPFQDKNFQNRGFLFGPVCPIYGFCFLSLQFLIRNVPVFTSPEMTKFKMFLICMIGSAVIEYSTSWFMERFFHARWWDYSMFPLNLNGRICLPVSIFWGLVGIVLVTWFFPAMDRLIVIVPPVVFETLALILAFIFGADYALTNASLTTLLDKIEKANNEFIEKGESIYQAVVSTPGQLKKRLADYEADAKDKARIMAESLSKPHKYLMQRITMFTNAKGHSDDDPEKTSMGNRIKDYLKTIHVKR